MSFCRPGRGVKLGGLTVGRSIAIAGAAATVAAAIAMILVIGIFFGGITVIASKKPLPPRTLLPELARISLVTQGFLFLGIATFRHVLPLREGQT